MRTKEGEVFLVADKAFESRASVSSLSTAQRKAGAAEALLLFHSLLFFFFLDGSIKRAARLASSARSLPPNRLSTGYSIHIETASRKKRRKEGGKRGGGRRRKRLSNAELSVGEDESTLQPLPSNSPTRPHRPFPSLRLPVLAARACAMFERVQPC